MRPFPEENERSEEIARELAELFDVAKAQHNFWLTHPKDRWIKVSTLPAQVLNVAAMLDVQASRLFRAVIEECRRGEAYAANIISRSLFETVLALRFVLARKRLRIAVDQAKTKGGNPKVDAAGNPIYYSKPVNSSTPKAQIRRLTQKQRADLYLAHALFQDERSAKQLATIPNMKRKVRKLSSNAQNLIASCENEIGSEWTSVLRNTRSYSGLNVEVLAKLMGKPFKRWYETVYGFQSRNVHAADPFRNVTIADGEKLSAAYVSSVGGVRQALVTAITLMFIAIDTIQKSVGYGAEVDFAYESMKRRYRAQLRN